MKNYMDALKRRKDENGDAGFSLIELIVVVVILGVLAAIAVPVFLGLQGQAETSSDQTLAANGASQAAAEFAMDEVPSNASLANLNTDDVTLSIAIGPDGEGTTLSIENFCVSATRDGDTTPETSGPGCS
jgi:MSHA pilin protein MshA